MGVRPQLSREGSSGQWRSQSVIGLILLVVMAGGKGWGEMEKTMKNKRKPPTPPDSLT